MREVELKAVVDDIDLRRKKLEAAGATLVYDGRLIDHRYDTAEGRLSSSDNVLRLRRYVSREGSKTLLDWKGPTSIDDGFKVREEISTEAHEHAALAAVLGKLGFAITLEIDREISQFELAGATIRFETYPRMDALVEVEGEPKAIETAIHAMDMSRGEFSAERLTAFIDRFEQRTGVRAAISEREMAGDYDFRERNA